MTNDLTVQRSGGGLAELGKSPTVLGSTQARIPIGGHVRPGIMVLTPTAAKNKTAVDLYQRGIAAGTPFKALARTIADDCGFQKSPLMPKNAPYFTVRPCDFSTPENAEEMLRRYGEDRGEGRQLYRFPVIFPLDNWQAVMPHQFACFNGSERLFWSEYAPDGTRFCMMHETLEARGEGRNRRVHRPAGGRKHVVRRPCDPDSCEEYQARKCMLSGRFVFHVPGLVGAAAIECSTRSFYSMQEARQTLEMVAFIHGRISGTLGARPVFELTKQLREISMIDPETGKAKRVSQWLIILEAKVDLLKVYQRAEAPLALRAGAEAAALLSVDDVPEGFRFDRDTGEVLEDEEPEPVDYSGPTDDDEPEPLQGELVDDEAEAAAHQAPGVSGSADPDELLAAIAAAKSRDDLMPIAQVLPKVADAKRRREVQHKMQDRYEALGEGGAA